MSSQTYGTGKRMEVGMGLYREQVVPRLQDKVMDRPATRTVRARACAGLYGDVVEIGFGTGLNVAYYPAAVTKVWAVEPSQVCMNLAAPRVDGSKIPVEVAGLTGEHLDLPSERFDAAPSTGTLCSILDVDAALHEIHRVLKPGGTFHFVEYGRAPDPKVTRWQERIEPVNRVLAGGCHLTRSIDGLIERAGFVVEHLDRYDLDAEPKPWRDTFEGRARTD